MVTSGPSPVLPWATLGELLYYDRVVLGIPGGWIGIQDHGTGCEDALERALRMGGVSTFGCVLCNKCMEGQVHVQLLLHGAFATGAVFGADDSSAAMGKHVMKPCTSSVAPDTRVQSDRMLRPKVLRRRPAARERVRSADRAR